MSRNVVKLMKKREICCRKITKTATLAPYDTKTVAVQFHLSPTSACVRPMTSLLDSANFAGVRVRPR